MHNRVRRQLEVPTWRKIPRASTTCLCVLARCVLCPTCQSLHASLFTLDAQTRGVCAVLLAKLLLTRRPQMFPHAM